MLIIDTKAFLETKTTGTYYIKFNYLSYNHFPFSSVAQLYPILCNPMNCSMPGLLVHHQLPELAQTHIFWMGDAIQPSHPPSSPSPPTFTLSQHQVFSNESVLCIRWPKFTGASASTSVLPMNAQDSFPLGWTSWISLQSKGLSRVFSNTTVQKHQILRHSAFLMVWLAHPYMTTRKTTALTIWTSVGKVTSLLFSMLSRVVTDFLSRSKHLLISWLQSLSAVILEPKKIKSVIVSTVSPSICHEVIEPDTIILVFRMWSF